MKSVIALINPYPKIDAVFAPLAEELNITIKKYSGIKPMADDLNSKTLPVGDLALVMIAGTSDENDAGQYRKNISLLEQLEKHSKLKNVPVLFLGYKGDIYLQTACIDCGARYLDLPVRKSELIERIRELCGKKGPVSIGPKARKRGSEPPVPGASKAAKKAESERRVATVMFADISGFTAMSEKLDPEEVTTVMNACFEMLGYHIDRNGGHIDKFIGDCVMVCFGVPKALENAPLSAVNTAIAMKNALYQFNREKNLAIPLDIHIGVNTGTVVSGTVGSTARKDYTVMGDAVNLASRIEGASEKGQILVGPDTYRATQDEFEYRALAPVSLKGKAEPVPVYELLSVKEKASRRKVAAAPEPGGNRIIYSEMVGRDEEMNLLRHLVTGLIAGKGGIVTVVGEAGIGKSRLMAEMKSDPSMKGVLLLEGRAVSMGRTLSFHPIIEIFKNWSGITDDDGDAAMAAKLDKAVRAVHPEEADEIVPFVATLMGMKLSGKPAERVKGIEGEALEKLIFKNVRELMIKGSELKPLVYYIEDLHWADTSSIELLSALFKLTDRYRILFILVFRPNYEDTSDRILKTLASDFPDKYMPIAIEPLSESETAALIGNLMNIKGLPQQIEEQIKERAGGNPFFIEEVVRSFIDEGAVVRKGETFHVTEKIHSVTVPLTINEVLMARIDRLDEETKNLVKTASVIGRNFFHKIITQVAGNISDIDKRLGYLEDIQLIRERKRMDEIEYLFKHALAQEAAYESLLIQKRKKLHLFVAQAIESEFSGRLHEFYGMLAYHYSKGENLDKTEEYLLKAGEEAMRASANSEALTYYRNAMDLYLKKYGDRTDRRHLAEFERNIGFALYYRGYYTEAVEYFDRVLENMGRKSSQSSIIKAGKLLLSILMILRYVYLPSTKRKLVPDDQENTYFKIIICLGSALANVNPMRIFLEYTTLIPHIYSHYDITKSQYAFDVVSSGSVCFFWSGISLSLAGKILNRGKTQIPLLERTISPYVYKFVLFFYNFVSGSWAREYDEGLIRDAVKTGNSVVASGYLFFNIYMHADMGDFPICEKMLALHRKIADDFNDQYTRMQMLYITFYVHCKKRDFGRVHEDFDAAYGISKNLGLELTLMDLLGCRSWLHIAVNDLDAAERDLHEAERMSRELKKLIVPRYVSPLLLGLFLLNLAKFENAIKNNNPRDTAKYRKLAFKNGRNKIQNCKKFIPDITETYKSMGTYYWLCGKPKKALKWWKKSIDIGERLGARLELSRTYFEVGKRALTPGPSPKGSRELCRKIIGLSPEECLDRAETMFREMGLEWDLEQLEKVRRGIGTMP